MSDCVHGAAHPELADYFYDVVAHSGGVPEAVSSHIRQCVSCRTQVARLKESLSDEQSRGTERGAAETMDIAGILGSHLVYQGIPVTCSHARPFLVDLAMRSVDLRIPTPITVHVDHCPQCAADLKVLRGLDLTDEQARSLRRFYERARSGRGRLWRRNRGADNTVPQAACAIAGRADSDVATVYRTIDEGQAVAAVPGDPYADYPIRVEVAHRTPRAVPAGGPAILSSAAFRPLVRRILKPAVVIAAVFALAVLFFCTQSTSGVALGEVVQAFERARNVHVVGFDPVSGEVMYELLVSRDANLMGMLTGQDCVVYDLATEEKADMVAGQVSPIDDTGMASVRTLADTCLGFPLASVSGNAGWMRSAGDGDREVYELMWTKRTYGGWDIQVRYEVVVDRATRLPASVRSFQWDPLEEEWECASLVMLDYTIEDEAGSALGGQPAIAAD